MKRSTFIGHLLFRSLEMESKKLFILSSSSLPDAKVADVKNNKYKVMRKIKNLLNSFHRIFPEIYFSYP